MINEFGDRLLRRLFAAINAAPGLRNLEDPAFFDRLQLADQAAQSAPHTVAEFSAEVAQGVARIGGFSAIGGVQGALSGLLVHYGRTRADVALFEHFLAVVSAPPDLRSGTTAARPLRHAIELRDVWFRYDSAGLWVLRGIDLTIPAGRALGLVGVNGAGKSTLVKLLCRFYDPQRGRILWDGVDVRELDIDSLRQRVGVTFQDVMAYDLTARENIGIGDLPRLSDNAAVRRAARLAGAHETISTLPRGYDTLLSRLFFDGDEHGSGHMLSGGQWQRVALARSMMRERADLLILDEPSSGLDAAAEHQLHQALHQSRRDRTSLLISHRLCTLRDADEIAVIGAGRVLERGSHDELMAAGDEYARLFTLQATGYQSTPATQLALEPDLVVEPHA